MKKLIALILAVLTVISLLAACGDTAPKATKPASTERDYSEFAGIVADPKTWYEDFMALPVANENMTEDELRKLAADAFRINLSFTWTPTQDLSYEFTLLERTTAVSNVM